MELLRKYGVATTFVVPLIKAGSNDQATQNNSPVDYTPAAGDVKVHKDDGAAANITTLPTAIASGNGGLWKFSLSATEMQAARVVINISDAATKAVEDDTIIISTYGNASAQHAVDLDDSVRAGLTALPNAAADAAGGLPISDTGGLALDTQYSNITTILGRIIGTIAAGTHNAQSGDSYIRLGAPAGASIAADLVTIANYIDTEVAAILTDTGTTIPGLIAALNNLSQAEANVAADTALADFFTSAAALVALIYNEPFSGYTTNGTFGKIFKGIAEGWVAAEGSVNDVTPTASGFITDLTGYDDNAFQDQPCVFISGTKKGQSQVISTSNGTTGEFTFDESYTGAPANGDNFIILATHVHPVSEIRAEIDANSTQLIAIAEDTSTTIPGLIAALNNPTAAAIAAAIYSYDMGNSRTIGEALAFLRNKWEITGSPATLVVYDTDDTTTLWTSVLTRAVGNPVASSDPV